MEKNFFQKNSKNCGNNLKKAVDSKGFNIYNNEAVADFGLVQKTAEP